MMAFASYNTLVILTGVCSLGVAGGLLGALLQLRRHSLLSDAISHATLPGIGIAFLVSFLAGRTGRFSMGLLLGAAISSVFGILLLSFLNRATKLKEDANLAIVISLFFGAGAFLLGLIQKLSTGSAAGLNRFIYGKTASLLASDAVIMLSIALAIALAVALFFKEFNVFLFDREFAQVEGYPTVRIDFLLGGLSLIFVILGLQAVGLILIIALFILPALAARCWTSRIRKLLLLSGAFGAVASTAGALWSASVESLPAGALIVLCMGMLFLLSFLFGSARGFIHVYLRKRRMRQMQNLDLLLQSFSESIASTAVDDIATALKSQDPLSSLCISSAHLVYRTRWSNLSCRRMLRQARKRGWISLRGDTLCLSAEGLARAIESLRLHEWQHMLLRRYPDKAQHIQDAPLDTQAEFYPLLVQRFPWLFSERIDTSGVRVS